jgi:hypothetical protein
LKLRQKSERAKEPVVLMEATRECFLERVDFELGLEV